MAIERQVVSALPQLAPSLVQAAVLQAALAHFPAVANALAISFYSVFIQYG